ncbi:vWA domain-containing protein [Klebsiella michiganensis]|uniref:vWA domain-containing protein n=1 Tax=Klebsiella michiganensis TaxID=1134687 RepID=UPI001E573BC7|nr:vWA domain-containing protein [Klebsiella michiganensis]
MYPVQQVDCIDVIKSFNKTVSASFLIMKMSLADYIHQLPKRLIRVLNISIVLNFSRKVIFIATDGDPSDTVEEVCAAVKNAKKHGIEIVCVGYGISKPQGFDGVYFQKINDISELNSLYRDLIRNLI